MLRLGLGGSDHDFSAALICDVDIRVAIEQERLSRRKHAIGPWFEDPFRKSIEYCLETEGVSIEDVDAVVSSDVLPARVQHTLRAHRLRLYPHHLCHAASAYLMLPDTPRAGVIVYDGFGSVCGPVPEEAYRSARETFSFFVFDRNGYECVGQTRGLGYNEQDDFPTVVTNSVGMLYELVTAALGYDELDSGKTMGLSSHGTARYQDVLERFVEYGREPSDCFRCATDDPSLVATIRDILLVGRGSFEVRADLAASVQAVVNRALLRCTSFFRDAQIDYLCVSGGCALNTVATTWLIAHAETRVPVVVAPHCGDAGIAFGALWLAAHEDCGRAPELTFRGSPPNPALARPGRLYTQAECRTAVHSAYPRLVPDASVASAGSLARLIASGAVVGVLNGRSEMGPRALGGRSIFADPRSVLTRERINRHIKHREPYRPLAPIMLRSQYDQYFDDARCADAFMLKVARAGARCRHLAPAVVHADGTARVQAVPDQGDPFLVELLQVFQRETGVGMLINTSFNRRGEPIVESPADAVDAFLGMGLDGLYLEGEFYRAAVGSRPSA